MPDTKLQAQNRKAILSPVARLPGCPVARLPRLEAFSVRGDFIGPSAVPHFSVNALPPTALAKARAHFRFSGAFIGAAPYNIITQDALAGAFMWRISRAIGGRARLPEFCPNNGLGIVFSSGSL